MTVGFVLGMIIVGFAIIFAVMILAIVYDHMVYGSSEWQKGVKKCTDIWQNTHNETLYYDCMVPLEHTE